MRAILIDWLVDVHLRFKLVPETMFLTVYIIDKYMEKKTMKRSDLQLLGVTSMLLASKYEEIYAPEVKDFEYITDKAYTKSMILEMETEILVALDFEVTFPSSYRFLQRLNTLSFDDNKVFAYAHYMLELALMEY